MAEIPNLTLKQLVERRHRLVERFENMPIDSPVWYGMAAYIAQTIDQINHIKAEIGRGVADG